MTEPAANPTPRPGLGRPPGGRPRGPSNVSILTGTAGADRRMSWAKALRRACGWLTSSVLATALLARIVDQPTAPRHSRS